MKKLKVDQDLIRQLAGLLDETGLTEIEVESDDHRIRVAKGGAAYVTAPAAASGAPAASPAGASVATDNDPNTSVEAALHPGAVTSPMVGTAYLSPEPGAPTFVKEGDRVETGQTLMIIEAMKTMNPVEAPRSGTVTRVLVSNEQPVEYGEPLLIIE